MNTRSPIGFSNAVSVRFGPEIGEDGTIENALRHRSIMKKIAPFIIITLMVYKLEYIFLAFGNLQRASMPIMGFIANIIASCAWIPHSHLINSRHSVFCALIDIVLCISMIAIYFTVAR